MTDHNKTIQVKLTQPSTASLVVLATDKKQDTEQARSTLGS